MFVLWIMALVVLEWYYADCEKKNVMHRQPDSIMMLMLSCRIFDLGIQPCTILANTKLRRTQKIQPKSWMSYLSEHLNRRRYKRYIHGFTKNFLFTQTLIFDQKGKGICSQHATLILVLLLSVLTTSFWHWSWSVQAKCLESTSQYSYPVKLC